LSDRLQDELSFEHALSPGSTFLLPAGTRVRNRLEAAMRHLYKESKFHEVISPTLLRMKIGGADSNGGDDAKDKKVSFIGCRTVKMEAGASQTVPWPFEVKVEHDVFELKTTLCQAHCSMFPPLVFSVKDMPVRLFEMGVVHRRPQSTSLSGSDSYGPADLLPLGCSTASPMVGAPLERLTQDGAHVFCAASELTSEVQIALARMLRAYALFDLPGFDLELILWEAKDAPDLLSNAIAAATATVNDYSKLEVETEIKRCGSIRLSESEVDAGFAHGASDALSSKLVDTTKSTKMASCWTRIRTASSDAQVSRLEIHLRQAVVGFLEVDRRSCKEWELTFINAKNARETPILLHVVTFASIESLLRNVILGVTTREITEWPFWLSPNQVALLPCEEDTSDKWRDALHAELVKQDIYAARLMQQDLGQPQSSKADSKQAIKFKVEDLAEAMSKFNVVVQCITKDLVRITDSLSKRPYCMSTDWFVQQCVRRTRTIKSSGPFVL
jgi:threonyl-tRNA synthetase